MDTQPQTSERLKLKWGFTEFPKGVTEKLRGIGTILTLVAPFAIYFYGASAGIINSASMTLFIFLAWTLTYMLKQWHAHVLVQIERARTGNAASAVELIRLHWWVSWILTIVLAASMIGSVALWALHPIQYFRTMEPNKITIEDAHYFNASDLPRLDDAPFLKSVKADLQFQAKAEGLKPNLILVASDTFKHPTPRLHLRLVGKDGKPLVGYLFRLHSENKHTLYEPLPLDYSEDRDREFILPPAKDGDQLWFIGYAKPELTGNDLGHIRIEIVKGTR